VRNPGATKTKGVESLKQRMAQASKPLLAVRRDVGLVWAGVALALVGWLASEYGADTQSSGYQSIVISANVIVLVGLIVIIVGLAYVSRSIRNLPEANPSEAVR